MVNIIINGALGRMGREIAAAAIGAESVSIVGALEMPGHTAIGKDYGTATGLPVTGVTISDNASFIKSNYGVVIDFSFPTVTRALVATLEDTNCGLVVGTTGLEASDIEVLKKGAQKIAIVYSPNMSVGVNLLFKITELVANRLANGYDMEIIEAHHRFKKDAPSGTARRLGEICAAALDKTYNEAIKNGRVGMPGERTRAEVGMHAVRGGDIVGDHTVMFAGLGERIELRHFASSRAVFAQGAVVAAKWIANRKPGLYSMQDVLDF